MVDHNNIILTELIYCICIIYGINFILCTLGIFRQYLIKRRNIFSSGLCALLDIL